MYALNKRFGSLDRWTTDTFATKEELADEIEYLLHEGWQIGTITLIGNY